MEEAIMKVGILRSWVAHRGFGFLEVPSNTFPVQMYFLHVSEIQHGENPPPVGSMVRFEIGPARGANKYPNALKAWIIDPAELVSGVSK